MANDRGRHAVIRKLVRARPLSIFLLLGSLALVAAIALTESRGPVTFPQTPGSDFTGEATESREVAPVDSLMARDVSGFASL